MTKFILFMNLQDVVNRNSAPEESALAFEKVRELE